MLWIGITGPIGSGKSTVANILRHMGYDVLDADAVARTVLSPGSPGEAEVFKTLGQNLRDPATGQLDRRALGRVVFKDPEKLEFLERIIHPRVRDEVKNHRERLASSGSGAAFYDVPLLFEKQMQDQFDFVLVVSAGPGLCRQRLHKRSQLSEEEIEERSMHHLPLAMKEKAASAVIRNEGSLEDLRQSLEKALRTLQIPQPITSRG